jgi:hypothetical protein
VQRVTSPTIHRRLEPLALVVLLAVVGGAMAMVLGRLGPVAVGAGLAGLVALAIALRFPYGAVVGLLVAGVFAASYLEPVPPFSGPVLLSVLILACGIGASLRTGFAYLARPMHLWLLALVCLWVLGAVLLGKLSEGVALTGFAATLGALQLGHSARGRRAVLLGLACAAVLASLVGLFTVITGWNPFYEYGLRVGGQTYIPLRFGFTRAMGAFTHPIMLGTFLGLGVLAALELARLGAVKERLAVLMVLVMLVGQLATISRGSVVATLGCVAIWMVAGRRLSLRWRVGAIVAIAAIVIAALWAVGIQDNVGSLFGTSATDPLASSTRYRPELIRALVDRLPQAPLLGFARPEANDFLPGFVVSYDNEVAYLIVTRGLLGLGVFTLLLLVPLAACVLRRGPLVLSRLFVVLTVGFVVAMGMSEAFWALFMPYLFAVVGLCWAAAAAPSPRGDDAPADSAAGYGSG